MGELPEWFVNRFTKVHITRPGRSATKYKDLIEIKKEEEEEKKSVYIVMSYYNGCLVEIRGVFSSHEEAVKEIAKLNTRAVKHYTGPSYIIVPREVQ